MSVDISFGIGYGVVVERDVFLSIEEKILDDNDRDAWCDRWAQCINTWTGDDYFVGIVYTFDVDDAVVPLKGRRVALDPESLQEFLDFYNKYHLEEFFKWTPDPCAVIFTW